MLAVTRSSGSYAVAGAVMALFGATVVFLSPARAALVDRYGPRRALVPMTAGVRRAARAADRGPLAPRRRPRARARRRPRRRRRGLCAAAGADHAGRVGTARPGPGPAPACLQPRRGRRGTALRRRARCWSASSSASRRRAAGIVVGGGPDAAGTAGFVSSPAVRAVPAGAAPPGGGGGGLRGLGRPVVAVAGVGLALGVVDLLVVAFAERHGHGTGGAGVAWVLAALSAGSAVGGLLNGAVAWRTPPGARLPLRRRRGSG